MVGSFLLRIQTTASKRLSDLAVIDDEIKSKMFAILVFGDPHRKRNLFPDAFWPIKSPKVNMEPRSGYKKPQNVASFCNSGDTLCGQDIGIPNPSVDAHTAYATDGRQVTLAPIITRGPLIVVLVLSMLPSLFQRSCSQILDLKNEGCLERWTILCISQLVGHCLPEANWCRPGSIVRYMVFKAFSI